MQNYKFDTVLYSNGLYQGLTFNDKRHGIGTVFMKNGSFIFANFHEDKLHGKFLAYLSNGTELYGKFSDGSPEGAFIIRKEGELNSPRFCSFFQ
jgi:hypothetical protein